jgi:hypothetical protein
MPCCHSTTSTQDMQLEAWWKSPRIGLSTSQAMPKEVAGRGGALGHVFDMEVPHGPEGSF